MKHRGKYAIAVSLALALLCAFAAADGQAAVTCNATNTITANVVVLDNPTVFNRLGAQNPNWITYALRRDVVTMGVAGVPDNTPLTDPLAAGLTGAQLAGNVALRPDKRPRPLVVRSVEGMCLTVNFQNLLAPLANPNGPIQDALINNNQVADRCAGFHASGVELRSAGGMANDGSMVGNNPGGNATAGVCGGGLVAPGDPIITYNLYTPHEGTFVVNSYGATIGSEANSGNLGLGMFAQLNVQPRGARMYRSQVTEEELRLAINSAVDLGPADCGTGNDPAPGFTCFGQPIINYEKVYPGNRGTGGAAGCDAANTVNGVLDPVGAVFCKEGKAGLPILKMLTAGNELVHSDINAIIAGPNADGTFPPSTYPLERVGKNNPQLPNRLEPFREYSSIFHDEQTNSQVFPLWYNNPVLKYTLHGVGDAFMINYGSGGIGSEIIANRLNTGPMHDCPSCAYEEFFLASQTVGDPGMLVQFPANTGIEQCDPTNIAGASCWRDPVNLANGPIPGNIALYQEDPSNVHNGYVGDFVKIRNIHAGAFEQHIFHLHNHQWLFNPNDDNGNYLDAQEIMPGSGHTYELVNGGAGNRNKTVGDAIFHCHFYPHFAQGMWYHIRNHDVFERGTVLAVSGPIADPHNPPLNAGFHTVPFALRSGLPMAGARALPDGELPDGSPIPAIVPLPGKPMPHMPAKVSIVAVDRGDFGLLAGREAPEAKCTPTDPTFNAVTGICGVLNQGPDSGQALVDRASVAGADGVLGTADDLTPGFPFWVAGNECGVPTATNPCPMGIVGQRAPTPPLDMLTEEGATANGYPVKLAGGWDGGLPRHALLGYTSGAVTLNTQNRLDFSKIIEMAQPVYFRETGTDLEKVSMAYQAVRNRSSAANNLNGVVTTGNFVLNGALPVPGGPFSDPCIDDRGVPVSATADGQFFDGDGNRTTLNTTGRSPFDSKNPRTYKVANVQIDAVFNKVGYHYPQERIIALWNDVTPSVLKQKPPEPLVMRFNTFDCGKILHTNLVPGEFELDDFQVRTPTDIIGQHIHLPKWDLTTNDGAANGWNYEDGTIAPSIVRERIKAINEFNLFAGNVVPAGTLPGQLAPIDLRDLAKVPTIATGDPGGTGPGLFTLVAKKHPFFDNVAANPASATNPQTPDYLGARTTIQRIFVDPVVNVSGVDRGLGLTFSHDHYGPSSFQQIGLYSTILSEPAGSNWVHNETGVQIGWLPNGTRGNGRDDGGPTTWQAAIITPDLDPITIGKQNPVPDHREFYFEMSDFQHAYEAGVYVGANAFGRTGTETAPVACTFGDCFTAINQPNLFNATEAFAPDLANAWARAINPPLKLRALGPNGVGDGLTGGPDVVTALAGCPGPLGNNDPTNAPRPCAEAINIGHSSMWVTNYRNEPVGLRVFDNVQGAQAAGLAGDLAFAFQTRIDRAIPELNTSVGIAPYPPAPYCRSGVGDLINCDRNPGDPFTPIMRTYERDQVKIKIQVGATEEQHQATVHGMKWLSNSSGFGRSPNSGWRNFQSHGISEQFSLQVPINPVAGQVGNKTDYLYATDATRDGIWSGTWGILRGYATPQGDLFQLPDNPQNQQARVTNLTNFNGVCPTVVINQDGTVARDTRGRTIPIVPVKYDVTAVLANEVLPNDLGVTIPANASGHAGGPLKGTGTLVYNRRGTLGPAGNGPLNDPTAILYVRTSDLVFKPCVAGQPCRTTLGNPVGLQPNAPVEPLVLRAKAGDCVEVTLRNALPFTTVTDPVTGVVTNVPDPMPDLAGWQDLMWVVKREVVVAGGAPQEMRFFNNNLVRPSSYVGLHAQLVAFDPTRDDGVLTGQNPAGQSLVAPGAQKLFRYYAGDIRHDFTGVRNNRREFVMVPTPVEFGGTNLLSADRVKQPQKGLFGALVIEPANATWPDLLAALDNVADGQGIGNAVRRTRAQVTVTSVPGAAGSGGGIDNTYREGLVIGHKITNLRWKDGTAIANVDQNELGREGAEDSGHAGFNYATEAPWFRFQLPPDAPFGNAGTPGSYGAIPNAHAMYSNALVAADNNTIPAITVGGVQVSALGDPVTPIVRAKANQATRMYVLNGASADRDGTFILHGHLWQRDPHVCTGTPGSLMDNTLGVGPQAGQILLDGRCLPTAPVPSNALGFNQQGKWMGGEEGMGHAFGHWPILFTAGGSDGVAGDYLYRDYTPSGNRTGQFGILRVN